MIPVGYNLFKIKPSGPKKQIRVLKILALRDILRRLARAINDCGAVG
jgi:hypothetical protein